MRPVGYLAVPVNSTAPTAPPSFLQRVKRWDWETIGLFLFIKAILLFFAVQTFTAASKDYDGVLSIWKRWDATHYVHLAEHGYTGVGKDRALLGFFPLYPWVVRGATVALRDPLLAGFVVSAFASIAAALLLRRLAAFDERPRVARAAVWFFAIFPTAYFLHIPYTESLFLALTLGCMVAARSDRWLLAGSLGACAALTRINGIVLGPALAVEAFMLWRMRRRFDPRWLWSLAVGLGFAGYLGVNYAATGDPLAFVHIKEEHWFHKLSPPWVGLREAWLRAGGLNAIEGLHEFSYIVLTFVFTLWCWVKSRPSYAVWMTCNWLLIVSPTFIIATPRYALAFFPIFVLLGRACTGRPLAFGVVTVLSLLLMALYVQRFVHGLWAF